MKKCLIGIDQNKSGAYIVLFEFTSAPDRIKSWATAKQFFSAALCSGVTPSYNAYMKYSISFDAIAS